MVVAVEMRERKVVTTIVVDCVGLLHLMLVVAVEVLIDVALVVH